MYHLCRHPKHGGAVKHRVSLLLLGMVFCCSSTTKTWANYVIQDVSASPQIAKPSESVSVAIKGQKVASNWSIKYVNKVVVGKNIFLTLYWKSEGIGAQAIWDYTHTMNLGTFSPGTYTVQVRNNNHVAGSSTSFEVIEDPIVIIPPPIGRLPYPGPPTFPFPGDTPGWSIPPFFPSYPPISPITPRYPGWGGGASLG